VANLGAMDLEEREDGRGGVGFESLEDGEGPTRGSEG